jgi:serine/threonine protein kinase
MFNIVLRDIKSDNILVQTSKGKSILKISDFGLARNRSFGIMTICGFVFYLFLLLY